MAELEKVQLVDGAEAAVPVAVPVAVPMAVAPVAATPSSAAPRNNNIGSENAFTASTGTASWSNALCDCCSIKDCGCCCCLNEFLCCGCVYSSAVAYSEVDPFDTKMGHNLRCVGTCVGLVCEVFPCQNNFLRAIIRLSVAKKYGIKESVEKAFLLSFCCCCCSDWQVQNEIMVHEQLVYGCATLNKRGGAPPASTEMAR